MSPRQKPLKRELDPDLILSPVPATNKRSRKRFAPLPSGAEDGNRFRAVFIPTYERWVGSQANPWLIPDHVATRTLQTIWDAVYLTVPWTVRANDCVFERVSLPDSFFFEKGGGVQILTPTNVYN